MPKKKGKGSASLEEEEDHQINRQPKKKKNIRKRKRKWWEYTPSPAPQKTLILVPGTEGSCPTYTRWSLEEYEGYNREVEKFLTSHGCSDDPTNKKQSARFRNKYFPLLKEKKPEFSDYVLVEPMDACFIVDGGGWLHMNFKAKHKDADDSSQAVYFAEVKSVNRQVTCLAKLNIDSIDRSEKLCLYCHADAEERKERFFPVAGAGFVYHPVEGGFEAGGRLTSCTGRSEDRILEESNSSATIELSSQVLEESTAIDS